MKKIYFVFSILFLAVSFISKAQAPACQFDNTWLATGKDGVYPDSATNFLSGNVGSAYVQHVTVKVPYDTTVPILGTVQFDHIDLQTSGTNWGLPPGLSLAGTPSNFHFPGNDTSCMVIYGTPTLAGTYNLTFVLKTYIVGSPFAVNTQTLTYYKIIINTPVGLAENIAFKFEVSNPVPNPSNSNSSIRYTLPKTGTAKLSVYNTIGKLVYAKKADGKQGENEFDVNVNELASGIYIYSIEFDGRSITKRLIVNKD